MAEVKDGLPATDFSRMNREYIKAVAENAAGGGGGGGGESNIFYIDISNVDAPNRTFTVSTSVEEMKTAIEAGKHCFLNDNGQYIPVIGCEVDGGYMAFSASMVSVYNGEISYRSFDYEYEDGEVTTAVYNAATKQW